MYRIFKGFLMIYLFFFFYYSLRKAYLIRKKTGLSKPFKEFISLLESMVYCIGQKRVATG